MSNGKSYYVFGKTTNTFKLSESHSSCGDAAAISLSSGATGTNHTFVGHKVFQAKDKFELIQRCQSMMVRNPHFINIIIGDYHGLIIKER